MLKPPLNIIVGIDRDAASQILSCLPPATREIVMLSLTMEASSLGHSSTFQSQSFDGSTRIDVADGNFKNDQALHDDITAVAASVATPTDANGSGSNSGENPIGGIDTENFSLALVPVDQRPAATERPFSSSIFKTKIKSTPFNIRRESGDKTHENIVNTIDLSSIPLVQAPKIDDDNDVDDHVNRKMTSRRLEELADKDQMDTLEVDRNERQKEQIEQNEGGLDQVLPLDNLPIPEQKLSSLFAERYFKAVQEVGILALLYPYV